MIKKIQHIYDLYILYILHIHCISKFFKLKYKCIEEKKTPLVKKNYKYENKNKNK